MCGGMDGGCNSTLFNRRWVARVEELNREADAAATTAQAADSGNADALRKALREAADALDNARMAGAAQAARAAADGS